MSEMPALEARTLRRPDPEALAGLRPSCPPLILPPCGSLRGRSMSRFPALEAEGSPRLPAAVR